MNRARSVAEVLERFAHLAQDAKLVHDSFYKFVPIEDVDAMLASLRDASEGLLGSILVAPEGINGMLAATSEELDAFQDKLKDEEAFGHKFDDMVVKRSLCKSIPFHTMKIRKKPEIVPLGVAGVDASRQTGVNVSPQEWRALIQREDVVVIDNRNDFEYRLGHFAGAVNPEVCNFRDFPKYIEEQLPLWQDAGKHIAMYCTGGIRCEKTSAWMLDLGVEVYQLEGGILNYFEQMPDADRDWQGECFVFDNRIALNSRLEETDTGVESVYDPGRDGAWRVERAQLLQYGPQPSRAD